MYIVLIPFTDDKDRDGVHVYRKGDIYPREGAGLNPRRAAYLAGSGNKLGRPVIEKTGDPETEIEKPPEAVEIQEPEGTE